jgi:adenosylmethionine-8-amino-7-oxononanoate aminotransferase
MRSLAQLDQRYVWHPFTQMRDWLKREPIVIVEGEGAVLRDARGRQYLDANSSIWTNLHGHNHPQINVALGRQLKKIAHSSALGFANEPASLLAAQLIEAVKAEQARTLSFAAIPEPLEFLPGDSRNAGKGRRSGKIAGGHGLCKVFFSDDGSTAIEVALKLAYEFARRTARNARPRFLSLAGAYHGDTVGAVALGHIDLFHKAYSGLLFKTDSVMAPYCYRCPFNRAKPERADARDYRKCHWECLDKLDQKFTARARRGRPYAGFVFEPLMQGAAGMIPQPAGWLRQASAIARHHGALLIADEVMTGFGRTGTGVSPREGASDSTDGVRHPLLFACHHEGLQPDFLALAKGLTGGYLPMAATLTTQAVFDAFLGDYRDFKTFFHGHSFTGNQLGSAAGLASLEVLQSATSVRARKVLEQGLHRELQTLWSLPNVGDIRQVGLIAGIELVRNWRAREPFSLEERAGIRVCDEMAKHGVLTRPIGNVLVLMPPYCTTPAQLRQMVSALAQAVSATCNRA